MIPSDELIFFGGVGIPPTSLYIYIWLVVWNIFWFSLVGMMIQSDELHHFSGGLKLTTNELHMMVPGNIGETINIWIQMGLVFFWGGLLAPFADFVLWSSTIVNQVVVPWPCLAHFVSIQPRNPTESSSWLKTSLVRTWARFMSFTRAFDQISHGFSHGFLVSGNGGFTVSGTKKSHPRAPVTASPGIISPISRTRRRTERASSEDLCTKEGHEAMVRSSGMMGIL